MSQENVEIVRRAYEAHNRGGADAAEPYWATDVEAFEAPEFPDAARRVGAAEFREMLRSYMEVGWDGRFEVQEYIDADPEVIVVWQMSAVGPASGISLSRPTSGISLSPTTFFHVWLLEEGKLRRLRQFLSREQALEAAGLRE
jgi:ketosteroid isomerase-like protein